MASSVLTPPGTTPSMTSLAEIPPLVGAAVIRDHSRRIRDKAVYKANMKVVPRASTLASSPMDFPFEFPAQTFDRRVCDALQQDRSLEII